MQTAPATPWFIACDECLKPLVNAGGKKERIGKVLWPITEKQLEDPRSSDSVRVFQGSGDFFDTWMAADDAARAKGWLVVPKVQHLCPDCKRRSS